MAVYKLFPTQDTTLYSMYPEMNTGLDEIIETSLDVGAFTRPAPQASRFLIQFSTDEMNDLIDNTISGSFVTNLRCFVANVSALNIDTTIDVFPVSQSWNMGTGKFLNSPQTQNGASWIWKDYQGSEYWISGSLNTNTTASYSSSVDTGGGTWYATSGSGSQTFGYYDDKDLNINITTIINKWYSSSIPNDGLIVKQRNEFVDDENLQPKLKYFSIDTHTIYPPYLEFKWDDSIIVTGSLSSITENPAVISLGHNPGIFTSQSINKFRVNARPEYPARTFSTSSYFTTNYYLPESSSYAVKDLDTNEFVIDFDDTYTKLSMDVSGSYFSLNMNGMQAERYYKILIKTSIDGNVMIFDDNYYFKIING